MNQENLTVEDIEIEGDVDKSTIADIGIKEEVIKIQKEDNFKAEILWPITIIFVILHLAALFGLYQLVFFAQRQTIIWTIICLPIASLGVTAGAHQLWCHHSYKARLPLQLFLLACNCMGFQYDIIEWCIKHRCHHKGIDTDADPHNIKRGFFFAHIGWMLVTIHPKYTEMSAKLDFSDLTSDPLLVFQKKYYVLLDLLFCFLIPTAIPVYFWKEQTIVAFYACFFRLLTQLHLTWCINSVAHSYGSHPYKINISPTENAFMSFLSMGEGGHNYHHTFPKDYRMSEMPYLFNWTRLFIDMCAALGLAYDLQTISKETIERQKEKQIQLLKQKAL